MHIAFICSVENRKLNHHKWSTSVVQSRFPTCVLLEFSKPAIPEYFVRATDVFFLRLTNKEMTSANTTVATQCECLVLNHKYIQDFLAYKMTF